jgi:hypothetical protein
MLLPSLLSLYNRFLLQDDVDFLSQALFCSNEEVYLELKFYCESCMQKQISSMKKTSYLLDNNVSQETQMNRVLSLDIRKEFLHLTKEMVKYIFDKITDKGGNFCVWIKTRERF